MIRPRGAGLSRPPGRQPPGRQPPGRRLGWWLLAACIAGLALYMAYERYGVAHLAVTSDPEGAVVRVNGRALGVTPLRGVRLSPGVHRIDLRHSHFAPFERRIDLTAGPGMNLRVVLERGEGVLVVYSNPRGAWVEVDGERQRGVTPVALTLRSGEHELVVGMDERRSAVQHVVVNSGQREELPIDLDMNPHGSLVVDARPPARVSLPGNAVAYTPGVRLPVGEYLVRIEQPGYVAQEIRYRVRHGDNHYRVDLVRAHAPLLVDVVPSDARVRVAFRETLDGPTVRRAYAPGMRLPVGAVEVRASAMGRRSAYRRVDLPEGGSKLTLSLERMSAAYGSGLRDDLASGGRGPALVVIPPGEFLMGSSAGPPSERPARRVALTEPIAVASHEVRVDEYRRFATATGRQLDARTAESAPSHPVSWVSVADAMAYADWLTDETGHRYRLLSEAEWEYVARGGSTSAYFFGNDGMQLCRYANVADRSMPRRPTGSPAVDCDDGFPGLAPVGSFEANPFGVHDMLGNVAEWVLDCGMPDYAGAADDGSPVNEGVDCPTHGVRGGSWDGAAEDARSAKRSVAASPGPGRGIRLLREL